MDKDSTRAKSLMIKAREAHVQNYSNVYRLEVSLVHNCVQLYSAYKTWRQSQFLNEIRKLQPLQLPYLGSSLNELKKIAVYRTSPPPFCHLFDEQTCSYVPLKAANPNRTKGLRTFRSTDQNRTDNICNILIKHN